MMSADAMNGVGILYVIRNTLMGGIIQVLNNW